MYEYPFGNTQQLNVDWFLAEWKNLLAAWEAEKNGIEGALQAEIDRAEAALADVFAARDAAAQSAANALESKNAAAQSASDASGYLSTVQQNATAAQDAARNAAQSESNATDSAQTAVASKNAAGQSERNAAQSEANALASKDAAAQSAADALANKDAAAQSAADALANKDAAAQSAANAEDAAESIIYLYYEKSYSLINGSFSTTSGIIYDVADRIVTQYIFLNKGAKVSCTTNAFEVIYGYYDRFKNNFVSSDSWSASAVDFEMPYDGFFSIQFRLPSNANISPEDFTETLIIKNTYAKSLVSIADGIFVNPDDFSGSDTEKLQAAINTCNNNGGTVLITRYYSLDNDIVITHNSNITRLIRITGFGNGVIEFANHCFKGGNTDHTGSYGGISFENLTLLSSSTTRANLIDGDSLIRIFFKNCVISGFSSLARSTTTYLQTIFVESCYIRSITSILVNDSNTRAYDLHVLDNVIESCRNVIISYRSNGIYIINNLIEGLSGTPISCRLDTHKLVVTGNYFEQNGTDSTLIETSARLITLYLVSNNEINATISDNLIHNSVGDTINFLIILPNNEINGQIEISKNFCLAGGMLVYTPSIRKYKNVLYYNNTTHEIEFDQGQYNCNDYVTVITAEMINNLFTT